MPSQASSPSPQVAIVGGGPAGLMAAEVLSQAGVRTEVFDAMPSVGRKFLLAGVGGMNITHAEAREQFLGRYGRRQKEIAALLGEFDADALRAWIHGLGIDTFVGSSGRVFPSDMKAAPLLRAWLKRLREQGVLIHTRCRWLGWNADGTLDIQSAAERLSIRADAVILALGGGSWQRLGSERLGELLAQSGSVRNVQLRLQHKDRNGLDCLVSAEAVSLNEQDCVLVALLDISDRRRTEMELVHAIETVMQDASWFSRTLIEKLANVRRANAPGTGAELADLTAREREVFDLICQGLADKEIAKELGLAPNTVRNHVATIYAKLDVHSRGEAIVWARERGFAPEPRNGNGRK